MYVKSKIYALFFGEISILKMLVEGNFWLFAGLPYNNVQHLGSIWVSPSKTHHRKLKFLFLVFLVHFRFLWWSSDTIKLHFYFNLSHWQVIWEVKKLFNVVLTRIKAQEHTIFAPLLMLTQDEMLDRLAISLHIYCETGNEPKILSSDIYP